MSEPVPLDATTLLRRVNAELVRLRRALSHDHSDDPFWAALELDAPVAQSRRASLRPVAHLLHVERAHARGRVHGRAFASLAAQAEWLASQEHRQCARSARAADLPADATLAKLRAGLL